MTERRYLPTLADLTDRLAICLLKMIHIPEARPALECEVDDLRHDIALVLAQKGLEVGGAAVQAIIVLGMSNYAVWQLVAKVGGEGDAAGLSRAIHALNGVRAHAKEVLSEAVGERVDVKVDVVAPKVEDVGGDWRFEYMDRTVR